MIDASKGFIKDGNKNRLREQDIHKIVDTFTRQVEVARYSRLVSVAEISSQKNDYNLNLSRYIDSTEPEDVQDIEGHLRGGIPNRDIDALDRYWQVLPNVRSMLFKKANRVGYSELKIPIAEAKSSILGNSEFQLFKELATKLLSKWKKANTPALKSFHKDGHPKVLIETIAEDLLATFKSAALIDPYDVYQHMMDYWAGTMQDHCYLIAGYDWLGAAHPRLIVEDKGKKTKATPDFIVGKKKYQSELVAPALIIQHWFSDQQAGIDKLEAEFEELQQQIEETIDEHGGDDELLADATNEKGKLTRASASARRKEIKGDPDAEDEIKVLNDYLALVDQQGGTSEKLSAARDALTEKVANKYSKLTADEIKTLVVDEKWLATLDAAVRDELDRVSQSLTERVGQLAERYMTPLPHLTNDVSKLTKRVEAHLKKMGAVWD